jgi:hypothetical protein
MASGLLEVVAERVGLAGANIQAGISSAASVVKYGQLAVSDVAAVASAAEAIDEVT